MENIAQVRKYCGNSAVLLKAIDKPKYNSSKL